MFTLQKLGFQVVFLLSLLVTVPPRAVTHFYYFVIIWRKIAKVSHPLILLLLFTAFFYTSLEVYLCLRSFSCAVWRIIRFIYSLACSVCSMMRLMYPNLPSVQQPFHARSNSIFHRNRFPRPFGRLVVLTKPPSPQNLSKDTNIGNSRISFHHLAFKSSFLPVSTRPRRHSANNRAPAVGPLCGQVSTRKTYGYLDF